MSVALTNRLWQVEFGTVEQRRKPIGPHLQSEDCQNIVMVTRAFLISTRTTPQDAGLNQSQPSHRTFVTLKCSPNLSIVRECPEMVQSAIRRRFYSRSNFRRESVNEFHLSRRYIQIYMLRRTLHANGVTDEVLQLK